MCELQNRMIHVWTKVCDFIVLSKYFPFTLQTLLSEHDEKNWSSSREDILLLSHSVRDIICFVLGIKFSGICIAKLYLVIVCSPFLSVYAVIPSFLPRGWVKSGRWLHLFWPSSLQSLWPFKHPFCMSSLCYGLWTIWWTSSLLLTCRLWRIVDIN